MDKTPKIDQDASSSKNERNDSGHEEIEDESLPLPKSTDNQKDGNQGQSPRENNVGPKIMDKLPQPQAVVLCLKCGRENTPKDLRFHNIASSTADSERTLPYTFNEFSTPPTDEEIGLSSRTIRNENELKENVKREETEVQNNEQNISQSQETHKPNRELSEFQYEETDVSNKEKIIPQSEESHVPNTEQSISQSEETHLSNKTENLETGINTYASQSSNVHQETNVNAQRVGIPKNYDIWAIRSFDQPERKFYVEQRKREAQLEREAKEQIRQLIEQDKINRKSLFKNSVLTSKPKGESLQTPRQQRKTPVKIEKQYSQTKLLIRLTNGDTLFQTFRSDDKLTSVLLFIEENRTDDECPFNLRTVYPKRIFNVDEHQSSLTELDLSPATVLIVSRKYKISDERSKANLSEKKSQASFSQKSAKSPSNRSRPNN